MQSVSARIWTRVAVFISYDDNHYTTGISYLGGKMDKYKAKILVSESRIILEYVRPPTIHHKNYLS